MKKMDKIPLIKQRHQCYGNIKKIIFFHFLFFLSILIVICLQLIIMLKMSFTFEKLNFDNIVNNSNFDFLVKTAYSVKECFDNVTCVKNFIEKLQG